MGLQYFYILPTKRGMLYEIFVEMIGKEKQSVVIKDKEKAQKQDKKRNNRKNKKQNNKEQENNKIS